MWHYEEKIPRYFGMRNGIDNYTVHHCSGNHEPGNSRTNNTGDIE
jgi:hypothetical protein